MSLVYYAAVGNPAMLLLSSYPIKVEYGPWGIPVISSPKPRVWVRLWRGVVSMFRK